MTPILLMLSQLISFSAQPDIKLDVTDNQAANSQLVFFAPHENEHVVNNYVSEQVQKHGGKFVILRQHGTRDIKLSINEHSIVIDPNRIFTHLGRMASLQKLNPQIQPNSTIFIQANQQAKLLSEFVLATMGGIDKRNTWVAIHNNTNGFDNDGKRGIGTISINRYLTKLQSGSKFLIDVNISKHDQDDLFFVTKKQDFDLMKKHQWNAILQNPQVATLTEEDDGSLSVYAEMNNIRYINIEAERKTNGIGKDHLSIQKSMVDYVFSILNK